MQSDLVRRIALVLLSFMLVAVGLGPTSASAAPPSLPSDPAAHGYVGLCDQAGRNITGGSVNTRPFVWTAVSSFTPPATYQGRGQNAVLSIYQPRPETLPGNWTGLVLTAATFYSTTKEPMAQETYQDASLADYMKVYPPLVNGLYVLRMEFGKQGYGTYGQNYPATTIQVKGSTWHVVQGGTVNCKAAKGVSMALITGVVKKADVTPRQPSSDYVVASGGAPHAITNAAAHVGDRSVPTKAGASPGALSPVGDSHSTNSNSMLWLVWVLIAAVVGLGGVVVVLGRARRQPAPTTDRPQDRTSTPVNSKA